jgi:hypothetical protein
MRNRCAGTRYVAADARAGADLDLYLKSSPAQLQRSAEYNNAAVDQIIYIPSWARRAMDGWMKRERRRAAIKSVFVIMQPQQLSGRR